VTSPADRPLDELDAAIIAELQRDGRRGYRSIARELGVPAETVRFRVNRMRRDGVIQITAMLQPRYLGGILATLLISVSAQQRSQAAAVIQPLPAVMYLSVCSGRADLMAQVVLSSPEELHRLIEKIAGIDGIHDVQSLVELEVLKTHYAFTPSPPARMMRSTEHE
jgi:Lrp/AsnC family transcriptional regulator for asnA, asnC and gidA